jgi:hypothetical protein
MVTDAILEWWFDLVEAFLGLFPHDPLSDLGVNLSFITDMNYFLPIGEMWGLFIIIFGLGGVLASTSLVVWILVGIVRGGSTKA